MELERSYSQSGKLVQLLQPNVEDYRIRVDGREMKRVSDLDSAYAWFFYYLAM